MELMKDFFPARFLGTFDDPNTQTPAAGEAQVVVQEAAQPQQPAVQIGQEKQVPLAAIPAIIEAATKANQAAANPPAPAPVVETRQEKPRKRREDSSDPEAVARRLEKAEQEIEALRLENYRANCINNARMVGRKFIDSLVYGANPAEIEASLVVAEQEYNLVKAQVLDETLSQLRTAQAAAPAQSSEPVAAPAALPPPEPPAPPPSVPEFRSPVASSASAGQEGVLTPEQVAYLTSSEALRNGDYLKYRHELHRALRQGMPNGPRGTQWSLHQGEAYPFAPPLPQAAQPGAPSYGSVQVPQVRMTAPMGTSPVRSVPAMQSLGRPAMPNEAMAMAPVDATSAQRAAQQAIAQARAKSGGGQAA